MTYVAPALRRAVQVRAGGCCEYCRLSRDDHTLLFEIDHMIAENIVGQLKLTISA